ncbi:Glutathione reductase, chloroplastic [Gossypium arboreum]|uniref:Glutathione reductase, chloroplastic n=1 Tax=Gossypium arboreum TaxID=29729 RepID=A0A0B0MSN7_GOSAR|nr:Glutathione reductase, chloroplastic [Gossypium arboreum]
MWHSSSSALEFILATLSGLPDWVGFHETYSLCKDKQSSWSAHVWRRFCRNSAGICSCYKSWADKSRFDATLGIHPPAAKEFVTMRTPTRKIRQSLESEKITEVNKVTEKLAMPLPYKRNCFSAIVT